MIARLLYRDAQGQDADVNVPPEGAYLGRGRDCLVHQPDPMMARRHCRIEHIDGQWILVDTRSTNGTYVNGARVDRVALQDGDVIRCGSLEVHIVLADPGP